MNTDNHTPRQDWESEMSRELDRRVSDLHEAPLTLDQVRGRAHSIRRTRRLAVAGGILAAAAVIVPIGVLAVPGADDGRDPDRDLVATDPTAVVPAEGLSYLEGRILRRPDGSSRALPEAYLGGADLGESFLGIRPQGGRLLIDVVDLDSTATVFETVETTTGIAVNAESTAIAYLAPNGDLISRDARISTRIASGLDPDGIQLGSFVGGPDCDAEACRVYFSHGDGQTPPQVASFEGTVEVAVPDALAINDANAAGLVTVQNESTLDGSCGGLYDESAGAYVWDTCDFLAQELSPSGDYLSAVDAYQSGMGPTYLSILDAVDGDEVFRFEPEDGFIRDIAWEDDEHLLATVYDPSGWSIYRIGADGTAERTVGPSPEGDETPSYVVLGGR